MAFPLEPFVTPRARRAPLRGPGPRHPHKPSIRQYRQRGISSAIKDPVMIRRAQPILAPAHRRGVVDCVFFQRRKREEARVCRHDLKRGPAPMQHEEAGAAPCPLDDVGQSGPQFFSVDGFGGGFHVQLKLNMALQTSTDFSLWVAHPPSGIPPITSMKSLPPFVLSAQAAVERATD